MPFAVYEYRAKFTESIDADYMYGNVLTTSIVLDYINDDGEFVYTIQTDSPGAFQRYAMNDDKCTFYAARF